MVSDIFLRINRPLCPTASRCVQPYSVSLGGPHDDPVAPATHTLTASSVFWELRSDEHIDHIVPFPPVLWELRSDEHIHHIVPFPPVLWELRSDEHIDHIVPSP